MPITQINRQFQRWQGELETAGWTWQRLAVILLCGFISVALIINLSNNIQQAQKNSALLAQRQQRLAQLQTEGKSLDEQIAYLSSLEYRERYAHSSLNLARANEDIYKVDLKTTTSTDKDERKITVTDSTPSQDWQLLWDLVARSLQAQL